MRFGKVFASLWHGSMVGKSDAQLVFVYMLANCERDGTIDCSPEAIGALTGMGTERAREAISYLESPDKRSRTPDEDGRRIVLLDSHRDWGWKIVNYDKYRENDRSSSLGIRRSTTKPATKDDIPKQSVVRRSGYVYVVESQDGKSVKIGFSKNPWSRVHEMKCSNPLIRLVHAHQGTMDDERAIHKRFASLRIDREWFSYDEELRNYVAHLVATCSSVATTEKQRTEEEPKGGFPSASLQENAASRAVECEAESAGADTAVETACSDAGTRAGSKEAPVGPVAIGSLVRGIAARLEMPYRATRTESARPATNGCEDASAPKSDTKRDPERNTEAAEYVTPVYEIAKPHGGAAVSETLSLCGRLHNCGIRHTGVLKGIARHWLDNRGRIRNRWAYYSPGSDGFDKLRQIIAAESAVEEHRIAEAATREWLESVRAP